MNSLNSLNADMKRNVKRDAVLRMAQAQAQTCILVDGECVVPSCPFVHTNPTAAPSMTKSIWTNGNTIASKCDFPNTDKPDVSRSGPDVSSDTFHLDISKFTSVDQFERLGIETLQQELRNRGLRVGSLMIPGNKNQNVQITQACAKRLFCVKDLQPHEYPKSMLEDRSAHEFKTKNDRRNNAYEEENRKGKRKHFETNEFREPESEVDKVASLRELASRTNRKSVLPAWMTQPAGGQQTDLKEPPAKYAAADHGVPDTSICNASALNLSGSNSAEADKAASLRELASRTNRKSVLPAWMTQPAGDNWVYTESTTRDILPGVQDCSNGKAQSLQAFASHSNRKSVLPAWVTHDGNKDRSLLSFERSATDSFSSDNDEAETHGDFFSTLPPKPSVESFVSGVWYAGLPDDRLRERSAYWNKQFKTVCSPQSAQLSNSGPRVGLIHQDQSQGRSASGREIRGPSPRGTRGQEVLATFHHQITPPTSNSSFDKVDARLPIFDPNFDVLARFLNA